MIQLAMFFAAFIDRFGGVDRLIVCRHFLIYCQWFDRITVKILEAACYTLSTVRSVYMPVGIQPRERTTSFDLTTEIDVCLWQLYDAVIRWWVFCALEPSCIAPTRDVVCRFNGRNHQDYYAKCHRFDQSALNILLSNYFEHNWKNYTSKQRILRVRRGSANVELLRVCPADGGTVSKIKSRKYFWGSPFVSHTTHYSVCLCVESSSASSCELLTFEVWKVLDDPRMKWDLAKYVSTMNLFLERFYEVSASVGKQRSISWLKSTDCIVIRPTD